MIVYFLFYGMQIMYILELCYYQIKTSPKSIHKY